MPAALAGTGPEIGTAPLRILLVEDHEDTARMMQRILQRDGHTVEIAGTLAVASAKCGEGKFDLIITDIELPDGVAYQIIEKGHACHGTKAIVVSGHGMQTHVERSRQAGFKDHLVKPFSITQLRDAVRRASAGE